jgi:hypothetical protein
MRKRIIVTSLGLFAIAIVIGGCSGSTETTKTTATATVTTTSTAATTKTIAPTTTMATTTASSASLTEILGLSTQIGSMKYDMTVTAPVSPVVTQTIWVKKSKMRTEVSAEGQTTVLIMDAEASTMYTYIPAQNTAMKLSWNPTTKSATEEAISITGYHPVTVGTETLDGKSCTIVQYTVEGNTAKMWLWQQHGIPLRVEAQSPQGLVVMEYKNISFENIPDSMFTLPEGVQIISMPGS